MITLDEALLVEPYPYQKDGIEAGLRHHYFILGDEMGLGKTLQALAIAVMCEQKTLVVCPAYLKLNWEREFIKFSKVPKNIKVINKASDFKDFNYDIFIMSYSMLKNAGELFGVVDIIIADESHYLKTPTTKRTKLFTKYIVETVPQRLMFLTGTPIDKNLYEFYTLILMCSYNPYKTSGIDITEVFSSREKFNDYFSTRVEFKVRKNTPYGARDVKIVKWKGVKRVDELKKVLRGKFLRRKASKVLTLPPIVHKDIIFQGKLDTDEYMLKALEGEPLSSENKSQSAYLKAKYTLRYAKDLLKEGEVENLIIFTDHINPINVLYIGLKDTYKCRVITGDISTKKRDAIVEELQSGKVQVLIATLESASVGFNMTKVNHMIMNDMSWKNSTNQQAIKRIHRIGQNNTCFIHYIIASPVDNKITNLLKEKRDNTNHIL